MKQTSSIETWEETLTVSAPSRVGDALRRTYLEKCATTKLGLFMINALRKHEGRTLAFTVHEEWTEETDAAQYVYPPDGVVLTWRAHVLIRVVEERWRWSAAPPTPPPAPVVGDLPDADDRRPTGQE